jgi:endonuclease YncB( thermonuclease family)
MHTTKTMASLRTLLENLDAIAIDSIRELTFDGQTFLGRVVDVIDGDTVVAVMRAFGDTMHRFSIRVADIDVIEMRGDDLTKSKSVREMALRFLMNEDDSATTNVRDRPAIRRDLIAKPSFVRVRCRHFDKYGRVLAEILRERDGRSLGDFLLESNLAVVYKK